MPAKTQDAAKLERVTARLKSLPPKCLRAFILVRHEGLDFETVAGLMKIPEWQVRLFVQRAFQAVQRIIRHDDTRTDHPDRYTAAHVRARLQRNH